MTVVKKLLSSGLIAGVIILCIGLFYAVIVAGIPYQDPTPEMQFHHSVNMRIGEILTTTGLIVAVGSGLCRIIAGLISRKTEKSA